MRCKTGTVCIEPGRCETPGPACGGLTGKPCKNPKQQCVDDPRDDCDPKNGGADCIGFCVDKPKDGYLESQ